MKYNFVLSHKGTIDAVFILRWLQDEYYAKEKNCVCVLWTYRKLFAECQGKKCNGHGGRKEYKKSEGAKRNVSMG